MGEKEPAKGNQDKYHQASHPPYQQPCGNPYQEPSGNLYNEPRCNPYGNKNFQEVLQRLTSPPPCLQQHLTTQLHRPNHPAIEQYVDKHYY